MSDRMAEHEKKFKFTEARIRDLPVPSSGQRFAFYDSIAPSLECRVTPKGAKTFNLYRWSKTLTQPLRITLGRWPALSVEEARRMAATQLVEVMNGSHPTRNRRNTRDELTLGAAVDTYIDWLRAQERKPTSIKTYEYFATRFLSHWRNRKLATLDAEHIVSLRATIRDKDGTQATAREKRRQEKADRRITANRVIRFLSQVFNNSIRLGWKGINPCNAVKPFPEKPSNRRLEDREVATFLTACDELHQNGDTSVDLLLVCLYSGVRRRNVGAARWADISLEFNSWVIPDTKNNLSHKVYLSPILKKIFQDRKAIVGGSPFVFPASSASGHIEDPLKLLGRVLKKAQIDPTGFTIHTLKHSFVSFAYEAGINPIVVSRMGGHKVSGITARYGHASEQNVREGYMQVAELILRHRDNAERGLEGSMKNG